MAGGKTPGHSHERTIIMATAKKSTSTKTKSTKTEEKEELEVVIKMTRLNPVLEIVNPKTENRYRFTQAAPYVLVKNNEDVNFLLKQPGMEIATPEQVAEYYDK